jgi:hypothetical protein
VIWVDQLAVAALSTATIAWGTSNLCRKNSMAAFEIIHDAQDPTRAFKVTG